jgi:hypothetical protein
MNVAFIIIGVILIVLGILAPTAVFGTIAYGSVLRYVSIVLGVFAVIFGVFSRKFRRH